MTQRTFKGKLLESKTDMYDFTNYVFENDKPVDDLDQYIVCTRFPNWKEGFIEKGDIGFVQIQYVNAGDQYTTPEGETKTYKYPGIHFLKFVKEVSSDKDDMVIM